MFPFILAVHARKAGLVLRLIDLRGQAPEGPFDLPRPRLSDEKPIARVREILQLVRDQGDQALRMLTAELDGVEVKNFLVGDDEIDEAVTKAPAGLAAALESAADAIERFHRHEQRTPPDYVHRGVTIKHLDLPVARAGIYAPSGTATYPSSVLMSAIPAKVAGVSSVVCCTPPSPTGVVAPDILLAARIAGVDAVYRVGGAQAIGAMAYGTESIPNVDVIAGPGSKWVALAKREVSGSVGIASGFAGPSEVVVVADETAPVEWAAIDLVVQAEHGPDGFAWLFTWSEGVAERITSAVARLAERSPRRDETLASLRAGGFVTLVDGPEQAMNVVNAIAPEHLELMTADADRLLARVKNAGAIFLGPFSSAAVGDYIAGPSHVLPTFGSARFASALGVTDFLRRTHAVAVSEQGLKTVGNDVIAIAESEQLPAHAEAIRIRLGAATWSV